jgi:hypothetical protein
MLVLTVALAACTASPSGGGPDMADDPSCAGQAVGTEETRMRYREAVVPFGQSCESETQRRVCQADQLFSPWSGSFMAESCSVGMALDCAATPNGGEEQRTRYASETVPFGEICQSEVQTRTCLNGQLTDWSGSFAALTCAVLPRTDCDGVPDGTVEMRTRFAADSVAHDATCQSEVQTRTCTTGVFTAWSGSYTFESCVRNCPGGIGHNQTEERVRYQAAEVLVPAGCAMETQSRVCTDGSFGAWSGTFTMESCQVVNVITVNALTDPAGTAGQCTLRQAVRAANSNAAVAGSNCAAGSTHVDRIVVPAGTIPLTQTGSDDTAMAGDLDLIDAGPVEIVGDGRDTTIIDGTALGDRIFDLRQNAVVELRKLTIQNGHAVQPSQEDGGGVRAFAKSLVLQDCRFQGNQAQSDNLGQGGALRSYETEVTIDSCQFQNNLVTQPSGIYSLGSYGGALSVYGSLAAAPKGSLVVRNSSFTANSAGNGGLQISGQNGYGGRGGHGGAIYAVNAPVRIEGCTFQENQAGAGGSSAGQPMLNYGGHGGNGGGVYIEINKLGRGNIEILDSTFSENKGGAAGNGTGGTSSVYGHGGKGGGLAIVVPPGGDSDSTIWIADSRFDDNEAGAPPAVINSSEGHGGGLYVQRSKGPAPVVERCRFLSNLGRGPGGDGGGASFIQNAGLPRPVVRESLFSGNSCENGGCAVSSNGGLLLINSTVTGNAKSGSGASVAGNAIAVTGETTDLYFCTIAANTGTFSDVRLESPTSRIHGTVFANETCGSSGLLTATYSMLPATGCGTSAVNGDPLLGALADNGGPTQSQLPGASSPLRGAVPAAQCVDEAGQPLVRDQRGMARPNPAGAACDIGAVERD